MAIYGQFKYSEELYGLSDPAGYIRWAVEIDWNRDLIFDGTNEASRMFDISVNRGRKTMLKSTGAGFQTIPPGTCVFKLRNNDGRYNAWNQDSPLYPYVMYGPEVRIRVMDQATNVIYPVFAGNIVDIRPYGYGANAYVTIKVEDRSRYLRKYGARTPLSTGLTPGQAIEAILNDVNWPTHWGRSIDSSTGTMNYHWASGDKKAWSECEDVAQSFLGLFFISADGKATFIDRNSEPASVLDLTQAVLLKDIDNPQPYEYRRNVTRLKVHPRTLGTTSVIYSVVGDPILVEAGDRRTVWANYSYNNQRVPAQDIETPVASTDYLANTNDDGSGTDKTADCTMTVTDFGDNAKVVFENTGATNFYVTTRQIRGKPLYEEDSDDVIYPQDPSTVDDPSEFVQDLKWQQSVNVAVDYSQVLGEFLDRQNPFPVVKVRGRPDIQFAADIFNVANLDLEELGFVGGSFRVGGIEHKSMIDTCQDIETTFYLEPYLATTDAWTWPIEDFGTDTVFGAG